VFQGQIFSVPKGQEISALNSPAEFFIFCPYLSLAAPRGSSWYKGLAPIFVLVMKADV